MKLIYKTYAVEAKILETDWLFRRVGKQSSRCTDHMNTSMFTFSIIRNYSRPFLCYLKQQPYFYFFCFIAHLPGQNCPCDPEGFGETQPSASKLQGLHPCAAHLPGKRWVTKVTVTLLLKIGLFRWWWSHSPPPQNCSYQTGPTFFMPCLRQQTLTLLCTRLPKARKNRCQRCPASDDIPSSHKTPQILCTELLSVTLLLLFFI